MGIYDRDYYRDPPHRSNFYGNVNPWSVNTWLIIINVAVFVLDALLARAGVRYIEVIGNDPYGNAQGVPFPPLEGLGHFSVYMALGHLQLWRFITFQFLHANLNHILFNMIALFFFGPLIESYLGSRKYLAFYLLCGMAGPVAYIALWATHILIGSSYVPLIGASAGIFGVLIAGATVAPNSEVLIWGLLPVKLRTFAWVMLGVAVYTVFTAGHNAGGEAAHLGGAAVGYGLIRDPRVLNVFDRLGRRRAIRYRG